MGDDDGSTLSQDGHGVVSVNFFMVTSMNTHLRGPVGCVKGHNRLQKLTDREKDLPWDVSRPVRRVSTPV